MEVMEWKCTSHCFKSRPVQEDLDPALIKWKAPDLTNRITKASEDTKTQSIKKCKPQEHPKCVHTSQDNCRRNGWDSCCIWLSPINYCTSACGLPMQIVSSLCSPTSSREASMAPTYGSKKCINSSTIPWYPIIPQLSLLTSIRRIDIA